MFRLFITLVFVSFTAPAVWAQATDPDQVWAQIERLPWQFDSVGQIGTVATIRVSGDYAFMGPDGTDQLLQLLGNLPSPSSYLVAPTTLRWFAVFQFEDNGYVPDREKLDPDSLLAALKANNGEDQKERQKRSLPVLVLDDWAVEPHYDIKTNLLEWGTKLHDRDRGDVTINYVIKLLGRHGVMNALLVSGPETFSTDLRDFKGALGNYSFVAGEKYSEYREGDKLAGYGLTALIVGGATAAAAKTGLLKVFGKFIFIGVAAVIGAVGAFFRKLFGRSRA